MIVSTLQLCLLPPAGFPNSRGPPFRLTPSNLTTHTFSRIMPTHVIASLAPVVHRLHAKRLTMLS